MRTDPRRWRRIGLVAACTVFGPACDSTAPQPATRILTVVAGAGQTGTVGQDVPVAYQVRVTDTAGTPLAGIAVTWSVTSGGGSFSARELATDAAGLARATHRLGVAAGQHTARAQVSSAAGSPAVFETMAVADAPAQTAKAAGDRQSANPGEPLPLPYQVRVSDQFGNPVAQAAVQFTARGGSVAPLAAATGTNGLAFATHTLDAAVGPDTVVAVVPATGDSLVFVSFAVGTIAPLALVPMPANYGLHDTFVRAGIAFACVWNTGVIILDVGDGRAGGTPAAPVAIDTVPTVGGQAHNAWWFHNPVRVERRYLFVGQEGPGVIGSHASGDIHVLDVSDLSNPVEVAFYRMPGAGAHNFWMDEAAQVLYAAFYNGGVVALDVSGTLSGDLASREIVRLRPGGTTGTYTWGVMLHRGSLYASDMISGAYQLLHSGTNLSVLSGGNNVPDRFTSDLWAHGDYLYTGTWGTRNGNPGNTLKIWQLGPTGAMSSAAGELTIQGIATVSDVQVSADGRLLVLSAEGGPAAGLYVYNLDDPANPMLLARARGWSIHTATIADINGGRYVFAAKNPGAPALLIFDLSGLTP